MDEKTFEQKRKQIAESAIRTFSLNIFMVGVSLTLAPLYFPVMANKREIKGVIIGLVLAIRPLFGIIVSQFAKQLVIDIGVEQVIIMSSILYALSYVGMAICNLC